MSHFGRGGGGGGGGGGPDRRGRRGGGGGNRAHPYRDDRAGGFGGPQGGFGPGPRRGGEGGGGYRGGPHMEQRQQQQQQQQQFHAPPAAPAQPPQPKIDRTKICPLLLRVYIQLDAHHAASSFAVRGSEPNEDSIIIYTWPDATLRELAGLIQMVNPEARSSSREVSVAFVYPDRTGTNVVKHVATIPTRAHRGRGAHASNDHKTLQELKFETGDSLSVALLKRP